VTTSYDETERRSWDTSNHDRAQHTEGVSTGGRAKEVNRYMAKKGAKSEYCLEVCMYLGMGRFHTSSGVEWSVVGSVGRLDGCRVRKGGLFVLCTGSPVGWRCVSYTGTAARQPSRQCLMQCVYSLVLCNYRCTDTATVIILFIPGHSWRTAAQT
jgi:hypothetical protein